MRQFYEFLKRTEGKTQLEKGKSWVPEIYHVFSEPRIKAFLRFIDIYYGDVDNTKKNKAISLNQLLDQIKKKFHTSLTMEERHQIECTKEVLQPYYNAAKKRIKRGGNRLRTNDLINLGNFFANSQEIETFILWLH